MKIRSIAAAALGMGIATVAFSAPALAEYQVCNKTSKTTSVAVGYYDDRSNDGVENGVWTSEGWWNIEPGDCATPIEGPLKVRYVYVYAEHPDGSSWPGASDFCTKDSIFTIRSKINCERRGFRTRQFIEVDTGPDAKSYTTNLTDD
ncbi:DUF1036 domain-containing protein [Zavarzinia compransoris]|uniref:DUF1036 domain-containing protein n=1 Tax=Zavarzinia marina TaxID=2911065 RepID=UPI001F1BF513|nr:DUF1036 domain-containing protein [Zavarzinia marina]MCF4165176.1 DUF1036 domain-containing protein [Zavarzinia marina]